VAWQVQRQHYQARSTTTVADDGRAAADGGLAGSAARPTGKEHGASLGMQCCGATHTSSYTNTRIGFFN
jgi:hypothetical protein